MGGVVVVVAVVVVVVVLCGVVWCGVVWCSGFGHLLPSLFSLLSPPSSRLPPSSLLPHQFFLFFVTMQDISRLHPLTFPDFALKQLPHPHQNRRFDRGL